MSHASHFPLTNFRISNDRVLDHLRVRQPNTFKIPPATRNLIDPNVPVDPDAEPIVLVGDNNPVTNSTLRSGVAQAGALVYSTTPIIANDPPTGCFDGRNHLYFSDGDQWIPLANCPIDEPSSETPLRNSFKCTRAGNQIDITLVVAANYPNIDLTTVDIVKSPSHGTIVSVELGVAKYQADVRYLGPDWFTFKAKNNSGELLNTQGTVTVDIVSPMPVLGEENDGLRFIYAISGDKVWQYNDGESKELFIPGDNRDANGLATNRDDNVVYYASHSAVWAYDYLREQEFKVADISPAYGTPFYDAIFNQGAPLEIHPYTGGTYHNGVYYFTGMDLTEDNCASFLLINYGNTNPLGDPPGGGGLLAWPPWDSGVGAPDPSYPSCVSICDKYMIGGKNYVNTLNEQIIFYYKEQPGYEVGGWIWSVWGKPWDWGGPQVTIEASDKSGGNDDFGFSVSIDGDRAIVGAPKKDGNQGQVYIYTNNDVPTVALVWDETIIPVPGSNISLAALFGYSVSIDEDYAIIGSPHDDDDGTAYQGSAWIYKFNAGTGTWSQDARLEGVLDPTSNPQMFGFCVAISGDYAIVGASNPPLLGGNKSSVNLYKNTAGTWSHLQELLPEDPSIYQDYGVSVSIDGDYAVVGSPESPSPGSSTGQAFIYYKDAGGPDNWGRVKTLTPSDGLSGDQFGGPNGVSISGDYVIVGASKKPGLGIDRGGIYIYSKDCNDWGEVTNESGLGEPLAGGSENGYLYGDSVSIYGKYCSVGTPGRPNYPPPPDPNSGFTWSGIDVYEVPSTLSPNEGHSGYFRVVMDPYKRDPDETKSPAVGAQKITDVNFIPWSDNIPPPPGTEGNREAGDIAFNPNSGTLMVVSNNNPVMYNSNQIAICDPSSGEILHTANLHINKLTGPETIPDAFNEITWDASGSIILSINAPTLTPPGSHLRSLNTGSGHMQEFDISVLADINILDMAQWISQPCEDEEEE